MPSHYKLTYYDIMGLGEPIRYIFKLAEVDFEDDRIPKNDNTYPKLPADMKANLPWGSLPLLEVDGKKIGQSMTIVRFLANRFNLAGADDFEKAKCDEISDSIKDFGGEWRAIMQAQDDTKKAELMKKMKEETLPFYMGKYQKIVQDNGGKWMVGKNITWIDIVLAHYTTMIMNRTKMPIVDGFPVIKKLLDDVYSVPQIKKWISERPDTE